MDKDGGVKVDSQATDKKLKQARLPFKVLDPKIVKTPSPIANSKKRKISDGVQSSSNKLSKTPRKDDNSENEKTFQKKIDLCENEVSSSSEADNVKEHNKKPLCGSIVKCIEIMQQREVSTSSTSSKCIGNSKESNDNKEISSNSEICSSSTSSVIITENDSNSNNNIVSSCTDETINSDNHSITELNSSKEDDVSMADESDIENESDAGNISKGTISDSSFAESPGINGSSTPVSKTSISRITAKTSEKKKIKRDKVKLDLELKRQALKDAKEKEKQEKEKIRKEKELLKKEEKEKKEKERLLKEKEREEKMKVKQLEIDTKNEEKKKKEDERLRIEEEKQRIEDEQEMKKKKKMNAFKSFFIKKEDSNQSCDFNKPGVLKNEMMQNLDQHLQVQNCSSLYLNELPNRYIKRVCYYHEKKSHSQDKDIMIVDDDSITSPTLLDYHAKLLQFHENYRPAYYGTWRKKSYQICARNPIKKDKDLLDYEVDSDEEWEEEEPGESLSNSEGEDDKEKGDEVEDDDDEDGFFVPHGYLSDDECCKDDDDESPEEVKEKQLVRQRMWDEEMQRKCVLLKPSFIGCIWWNPINNIVSSQLDYLKKFECKPLYEIPINVTEACPDVVEKVEPTVDSEKTEKDMKKGRNYQPVPEEAMPDLLKLVHGSIHSVVKLLKEFNEYLSPSKNETSPSNPEELQKVEHKTGSDDTDKTSPDNACNKSDGESNNKISKRQFELKVKSIASYEKRDDYNKSCWYVNIDTLKQYDMSSLSVPNTWNWITQSIKPTNNVISSPTPPPAPTIKHAPTIKQFTVPHSNLNYNTVSASATTAPPIKNADKNKLKVHNLPKKNSILQFVSSKNNKLNQKPIINSNIVTGCKDEPLVIDDDDDDDKPLSHYRNKHTPKIASNEKKVDKNIPNITSNEKIVDKDDCILIDDEDDNMLPLPQIAPKGQPTVLTMFNRV